MRLRLLATLAVALSACQSAAPPVTGPLPESSVYRIDAAWTTDAGSVFSLADLRGAPVALAMVYTSCGVACPTIVRDMKALGAAAGTPLRYVLVSIDPERDTPERLRAFREAYRLGGDWTLLRGEPGDVQTLAATLGVRYRADPNGMIAHSNLITLLSTGGDVVARQEGLGTDPTPAVTALQAAL